MVCGNHLLSRLTHPFDCPLTAIYAQSFGQRYIKPETANLIYTIQPLYTALFAWLLLGETLGPLGYGGGMVVLLAVLLVATEETTP